MSKDTIPCHKQFFLAVIKKKCCCGQGIGMQSPRITASIIQYNYKMCTKKDTIKKRKRKSKKSFKLPTLKDIEKYSDDNPNIKIYPEVVYNYFKEANWKYPNGKRAYNVANMVNFLNGKFIRHESLSVVQNKKVSKHKLKKEKWVPYEEQLQDSRWFEFRRKVFEIRGAKCEHCGSLIHLQVHHPKYIKGRKAWEYKISDVIVLCRDCHKKVHNIKE